MHLTSTIVAGLACASGISAHMKMSSPVPYGKSSLTNSPLAADGSDFPCKQRAGVYDTEGASNVMALGSQQSLSLTGSATHGGGSCQLSISYDVAPNAQSVWKVIHSIEGGCPVQGQAGNTGNDPNAPNPPFPFTIPSNIPTGNGTLSWIWYNKIGNRETYMNCAPIQIVDGASRKRSARLQARDQAAYNSLPNMFVANFPSANCQVGEGTDVAFPDPGDSLTQLGLQSQKPAAPTGAGCGVAKAQVSAPASAAASAQPTFSAAPGIFVTVDPSAKANPTGGAQSAVASSAAATSAAATSAVASSVVASSPPLAQASPPAVPATGSTSGVLSGSCTEEGVWNCISGTSFQRCASGQWSTMQALAAGTACTAGQGPLLNMVQ